MPKANHTIETPRLFLSEVALSDAPFVYALMNSQSWLRFIGDRGISSEQVARDYIEKSFMKSYQENGFGMYKSVLKSDGTTIGLCGLVTRASLGKVEIGFAFLPDFGGKGYAYESSLSVLEDAKQRLLIEDIYAITNKDNIPSQKLLRKIGLHYLRDIRLAENAEAIMLFGPELELGS